MIDNEQQSRGRKCIVCNKTVRPDDRNTSAIKAGGFTEILVHDTCAKALSEEMTTNIGNTYSGISEDWQGRMAQVGVGGTLNGEESGVGRSRMLNKPCAVCHKQVTQGVTMQIGDHTYAAHPDCKLTALEMIAGAVGMNAVDFHKRHPESIVGQE